MHTSRRSTELSAMATTSGNRRRFPGERRNDRAPQLNSKTYPPLELMHGAGCISQEKVVSENPQQQENGFPGKAQNDVEKKTSREKAERKTPGKNITLGAPQGNYETNQKTVMRDGAPGEKAQNERLQEANPIRETPRRFGREAPRWRGVEEELSSVREELSETVEDSAQAAHCGLQLLRERQALEARLLALTQRYDGSQQRLHSFYKLLSGYKAVEQHVIEEENEEGSQPLHASHAERQWRHVVSQLENVKSASYALEDTVTENERLKAVHSALSAETRDLQTSVGSLDDELNRRLIDYSDYELLADDVTSLRGEVTSLRSSRRNMAVLSRQRDSLEADVRALTAHAQTLRARRDKYRSKLVEFRIALEYHRLLRESVEQRALAAQPGDTWRGSDEAIARRDATTRCGRGDVTSGDDVTGGLNPDGPDARISVPEDDEEIWPPEELDIYDQSSPFGSLSPKYSDSRSVDSDSSVNNVLSFPHNHYVDDSLSKNLISKKQSDVITMNQITPPREGSTSNRVNLLKMKKLQTKFYVPKLTP
ncbi:PREDICTED: uncharacterized protein LOC106809768 [Priapulus caudatus]|uniref:Uncharacterized protein LOC106809768 n=1 Tax=Priapulus caudatus TaxID=37621 RepID=A0ABM1E8D4_PRICU|nr:PREDICTED: uncharacterized protein LOC106809768 [Priapulus caudatus]